MPLPKISHNNHKLIIPSTGKEISYRSFLFKEEKHLNDALNSKNITVISKCISSIIQDCILTKGVDVKTLPTFDIEYLFLNIRGKSIGEEVEVNILCPDDKASVVTVSIKIDDIGVVKNDNNSKRIKIDDTLMMEMKYPSLDQFVKSNFDSELSDNMESSIELISSCVDKIFSEEEVWAADDCTENEIVEFLEQMNSSNFKDIEQFFLTMPKLEHVVDITNPNTGVESTIKLSGLSSFFM